MKAFSFFLKWPFLLGLILLVMVSCNDEDMEDDPVPAPVAAFATGQAATGSFTRNQTFTINLNLTAGAGLARLEVFEGSGTTPVQDFDYAGLSNVTQAVEFSIPGTAVVGSNIAYRFEIVDQQNRRSEPLTFTATVSSFPQPTVAFSAGQLATGSTPANGMFTVNLTLAAQGGLSELRVFQEGITAAIQTISVTGTTASQAVNITVPAAAVGGDVIDYTFVAVDADNQTSMTLLYQLTVQFVPTFTAIDTVINGTTFRRYRGIINQNTTLTLAQNVLIAGVVQVASSSTLTVPAGDVVYFTTGGKLDVQAGGQLVADGSLASPIAFTALSQAPGQTPNDARGQWVGVELRGTSGTSNSGVLNYVRIEYAGAGDNPITLRRVGTGTLIDFVQIFRCSEGFRFRGGTAQVKHILVTDVAAESFRWSDDTAEAWSGAVQFLILYNSGASGKNNDVREIRATAGSDADGSAPILANVTILGPGGAASPFNRGVRIDEGTVNVTRFKFFNTLVTGINPNTSDAFRTFDALAAPFVPQTTGADSIDVRNTYVWNNGSAGDQNWHSSMERFRTVNGNSENGTASGIVAGTTDYVGSVATTGNQPSGTFFTTANYAGAVQSTADWTSGWVRNPNGTIRP